MENVVKVGTTIRPSTERPDAQNNLNSITRYIDGQDFPHAGVEATVREMLSEEN